MSRKTKTSSIFSRRMEKREKIWRFRIEGEINIFMIRKQKTKEQEKSFVLHLKNNIKA